MTVVTLLTDFGIKSGYVPQMKGVITSITSNAQIIDLTHEIHPQDIQEASFVLQSVVSYFPVGSVHVAVVDPGVGTERRGIVVITRSQILIGPDNGLLMPAAHLLGDFVVYEIANKEYMLDSISNTFHGRDIFAPVAAHIINGIPFEKIGPQISDFIDFQLWKSMVTKPMVNGVVLHTDPFGNIITNIDGDSFANMVRYGDEVTLIANGEKQRLPFVKSYASVKKGEFLMTVGSSNFIEISINEGNAAQILQVNRGAPICVHLH